MDEQGAKGESVHKMPPKDGHRNVLVIYIKRGRWMDEEGAKGEYIHKMPPKDGHQNVLVIYIERG